MLVGIAVNNSIILVDRINQLKADGTGLTDAIVQAGQQRIRPIIMTTLYYDICPAPDDVQLWRRCFVAFADGYCCDRRVGDIYFDEFDGDTMCLLCVGKTQE